MGQLPEESEEYTALKPFLDELKREQVDMMADLIDEQFGGILISNEGTMAAVLLPGKRIMLLDARQGENFSDIKSTDDLVNYVSSILADRGIKWPDDGY